MISSIIRAYNVQGNRFPSIFLYQNTNTGLFQFSEVEAEINEGLLPLELLSLELTQQLEKITRIEVHALSGIALEICDEILQSLQYYGLMDIQEFDKDRLIENMERITEEIGEDWLNPHIRDLSSRKLIKQYSLSKDGLEAIKTKSKTVRKNSDLDIVVTGTPFYLFYDRIDLKTDGFEMVEMDKNLVKHVLGHAEKFSKFTGIKPLSIGSNSVTEGKEVSNSQFWITIEGDPDQHLDDVKYNMYLSAGSFERWTNPDWNSKLREMVPEMEYVEDIVVKAMSETWMMVEDVIEDGLEIMDDKITWKLQADLEMQKLIYNVMPEPISRIQSEIKLRLPNDKWNVVIMLQLESWDELSEKSLRSGRFHAISSRKGFTLEEGYLDYQEMMQSWSKSVKRQDYLDTLETLVKYNCLIERLPQVKSIVVDVDDIVGHDRRGRQKWLFNRIREIENLLSTYEVEFIRYLATKTVEKKIDETDEFQKWVEDGKIEIIEADTPGIPEVINQARMKKSHYLGMKNMAKKKQEKEYSRTLKPVITKKRMSIPGLEPFYDWRHENLFEKMYEIYYE